MPTSQIAFIRDVQSNTRYHAWGIPQLYKSDSTKRQGQRRGILHEHTCLFGLGAENRIWPAGHTNKLLKPQHLLAPMTVACAPCICCSC